MDLKPAVSPETKLRDPILVVSRSVAPSAPAICQLVDYLQIKYIEV
jgi:hypothetical protein